MAEHLLFLGDIKGTKSALATLEEGGREALMRRIENLQESFAGAFAQISSRSRSLCALTFSDSVIAHWSDIQEGRRFAIEFMAAVWKRLDRNVLRFRGFMEAGDFIVETSPLAYALGSSSSRFARVIPASVAVWSLAMAEASHFPDGLFVSMRLLPQFRDVSMDGAQYQAGPFEYRRLTLDQGDRAGGDEC